MRWQDKAVTVTAAEHRIPEYWFPFQRNMKTYDIHGLKNSKFIPRKLLWPRRCGWAGGGWEDRPAGELQDQDVNSEIRTVTSGVSGGEGDWLAFLSDICTLLSRRERAPACQLSLALASTGPRASWLQLGGPRQRPHQRHLAPPTRHLLHP